MLATEPSASASCAPTWASSPSRWAAAMADPVPLEYSIGRVTCTVANVMSAVMVGLPGAAQDRLHADMPGTQPGRPGVPRRPGEGCRAARAPARERGAAPARRPGTVRAGRPGAARRAGAAYPAQALDRRLRRDARDAPRIAPQTGWQQVRHEQAAQARPSADGPERRPPDGSPGDGESAVGTPPDPRRTDEARRDGRTVHRVGDPACCGHRFGPKRSSLKL
jgi:hypothetical protein